jgi:homogentisate phytyltransferase/homogentisate geranylgeranyltransferase
MKLSKIRGYIDLIRPFTLLAPIIVSICIMIASFVYAKCTNDFLTVFITKIIPASFSLAILNAASNALNQVTDLAADKISKPYRPIPLGLISTNEALSVSMLLYLLAFSISLFINLWFILFVFLISVFTVTYSLPPRIKDTLFINQLWVGVPRGLLGILAAWSVFGNPFTTTPLVIGLIAMFFLIGGIASKDITDIEADKKTGTKTLVNTYDVKKAAIMALPFMLFPFVFIPMFIHAGILEAQFGLLTLLAIPSFFVFYLMIRDKSKVKKLENTSSWALMYITYFFLAIGFSILTITGPFF